MVRGQIGIDGDGRCDTVPMLTFSQETFMRTLILVLSSASLVLGTVTLSEAGNKDACVKACQKRGGTYSWCQLHC